MTSVTLSIAAADLAKRLSARLQALSPVAAARVIWQKENQRVLLHIDSLKIRLLEGWLLCDLDVESDPTGRQKLQFVFYLGSLDDASSLQAAGTINAVTPQAAQLAGSWGTDLQRVLWDAVLDAVEASMHQAGAQNPGQPLTLQGFAAAKDAIQVEVIAGVA
jgi:hypothetical protein